MHKIVYTYTNPKTGAEVKDEKEFLYDVTLSEDELLSKPSIEKGYTFVGWDYDGTGDAPATMPDADIVATGYFKPEDTSYTQVIYLQNLDQSSKDAEKKGYVTNTYTLDEDSSVSVNDLHDKQITFGKAGAPEIEGFTISKVAVSYGSVAGGAALPAGAADSVEGVVNADPSKRLYVNYYYTRDINEITLNLWADERGNGDVLDTSEWSFPYGYEFSDDELADFETHNCENWIREKNDKIPNGYILAKYIDWSTGSRPATMPAGHVTVTRAMIAASISKFDIEIYAEQVKEKEDDTDVYQFKKRFVPGDYKKITTLTYYGSEGANVTIGDEKITNEKGETVNKPTDMKTDLSNLYINYKDFAATLNHFEYYHIATEEGNVLSGQITDPDSEAETLTLELYLERNTVSTTITYYYNNGVSEKDIARETLSGKWGTTYEIDPTKYFDGTPAGSSTSYRSNCMLNMDGYYNLDGGHWPGRKFESKNQIVDASGNKLAYNTMFGYGDNYMKISYVKVNPQLTYELAPRYSPIGGGSQQPITYRYGDARHAEKDYELRIANLADIFVSEYVPATSNDEVYPAADMMKNGFYAYGYYKDAADEASHTVTYTNVKGEIPAEPILQEGFAKININGSDYYLKDNCIYIPEPTNQFYVGNRTSYVLALKDSETRDGNPQKLGKSFVENYLRTYNEKNTKSVYEIYNHSFSNIVRKPEDLAEGAKMPVQTLTVNFTTVSTYDFTRYMEGGEKQINKIPRNGKAILSNDGFSDRNGFEIKWYEDGVYTKPVAVGKEYEMTGNVTVYGRYERARLACKDYVSYELETPVSGVSYITDNNVSGYEWTNIGENELTGSGYEKVTKPVSDADGVHNDVYYYVHGNLALIEKVQFNLSFSDIEMSYNEYEKEGFTYDNANKENKLKAYCQANPIHLIAYFKRNRVTLTKDYSDPEVANDDIITTLCGKRFCMDNPVRPGYKFTGWKAYKWVTDENGGSYVGMTTDELSEIKYADIEGQTKVSFEMPNYDMKLEAQWSAASFDDYAIKYYFQGADQSYHADILSNVLAAGTDKTTTGITIKDSIGTHEGATAYFTSAEEKATNTSPIAYSYTEGDWTYFYEGGSYNENVATVGMQHLFAMVKKNNELTSEQNYAVARFMPELSRFAIFDFVSAVYKYQTTTTTLNSEGTFDAYHNMDLAYYFKRSSNSLVRVYTFAKDGGSSGVTVAGAGSHYYGESVTLYATVAAGYSFVGWYKASEVLDENNKLKNGLDYDKLEKLNADDSTNYTLQIADQDLTYVAITESGAVAVPTVTASSVRNLEENPYYYNYGQDEKNVVKVAVSMPAGSDASYIKGYQWYVKYYDVAASASMPADEAEIELSSMEKIDGATASSYAIPTGKHAGTYIYRCVVTAGRKDNQREATVSANVTIPVLPAEDYVYEDHAEHAYDGQKHGEAALYIRGISSKEYELYYSKVEDKDKYTDLKPLTPADLTDSNKVTSEKPAFANVRVNEKKEVIPHVVYYYLKSNNQDYADVTGSIKTTIKPVYLTMKAQKAFVKTYDGKDIVAGSVSANDSDYYRLADSSNGYYSIDGLLESEKNLHIILDYDSRFNSAHAADATAITMSNIWVNEMKDNRIIENYNYQFPVGTTIAFSAQIKPYKLAVMWDEQDVFVYDGTVKHPQVHMTDEHAPDGSSIKLKVNGGQISSSDGDKHTATVEVVSTETYKSSDYTFDITSKQYEILPRYIKVHPVDTTVVYNGKPQTITTFWFETKDSADGAYRTYTLPSNERYQAVCDASKTNVISGGYTLTAQNLKLLSEEGTNIAHNYVVEYGTGVLTITPAPVVIQNVKAEDKQYDGTTNADIVLTDATVDRYIDNAVVSGLYGTEKLTVSGITGTFENATADNENNKTVNLDYSAVALSGDTQTLSNYVLDKEHSQKTTSAKITGNILTAKADNVTRVYGEEPAYTVSYTGFQNGEGASIVSGTPSYVIKKVENGNETECVADGSKLPVGTYHVYVDADESGYAKGLSTANYQVKASENYATLTVTKRPVEIQAVEGVSLSKEYDGTKVAKNKLNEELVTNSAYKFVKLSDNANSGVLEGDSIDLNSFSAIYNDANVADAKKIIVSNMVLSNDNYMLSNASFDIAATITKKNLKLHVKDATLTYGDAVPEKHYKVSVDKTDGFVEADVTAESAKLAALTKESFACDYINETRNVNRNAGTYSVSLNSVAYENSNYAITATPATLTVNKKVVHVKATDQNIVYHKESSLPAFKGGFVADEFCYEETESTAGVKYGENDYNPTNHMNQAEGVHFDTVATIDSLPGNYVISPANVDKLSSGNYEFVPQNGTLKIDKYYVIIDGYWVNGKEYDGTVLVDPKDIMSGAVTITYCEKGVKKTVNYSAASQEVTDSIHIEAQYADKNVGTNKTVNVKITLVRDSELDKKYILLTENEREDAKKKGIIEEGGKVTQTIAFANVEKTKNEIQLNPRPLVLKPADLTVKYGETVTVTTASAGESKTTSVVTDTEGGRFVHVAGQNPENFDTIGFELVYQIYNGSKERPYRADAEDGSGDVGTYTIDISGSTTKDTIAAKNYSVSCLPGKLTVSANQLATPTVAWDLEKPGTLTYSKVASIGAVDVDSYTISVYKDGAADPVYSVSSADSSVASKITENSGKFALDLAGVLRTNGAGKYTAKVCAIASTTHNEEKKNVRDSAEGVTARALAAANVTVKYAEDITTKGATNGTDTTRTIAGKTGSGADSYILLEGESAVPVTYSWVNENGYRTGYKVSAVQASSSVLSVSDKTDSSEQGEYSCKVSLGNSDTIPNELSVTLALEARAAQATVVARECYGKNTKDLPFGYSAEIAPKYEAEVTKVDTDNVDIDAYDVTYEWYYQEGSMGAKGTSTEWRGQTWQLPTGLRVSKNAYNIYCSVQVVRKDNGQSVNYTTKKISVYVKRAKPDASSVTITEQGWTYGQERVEPEFTKILEGIGTCTAEYATSSDAPDNAWSTQMPTDAGTYYVRAQVAESDNFEPFASVAKEFTISQATLATPLKPEITASVAVPYGLAKWYTVSGIAENNGVSSASTVDVTYEVALYKKVADSEDQLVKTYSGNAIKLAADGKTATCNMVTEMNAKDEFYFTVKALPTGSTEAKKAQAQRNCQESSPAKSPILEVSHETGVTNAELKEGKYQKTYDGKPVTLSVEGAYTTYQWYHDGTEITGATGKNYEVIYAEQNGTYSCHMQYSDDEKVYYSTYVDVIINPREITLTADPKEKIYDGSALSMESNEWKVTDNGTDYRAEKDSTDETIVRAQTAAKADGFQDYVLATVSGSRVFAGSTTSAFSAVKIFRDNNNNGKYDEGDKYVYDEDDASVIANYKVIKQASKILIKQRPVTITSKDLTKPYDLAPLSLTGVEELIVSADTPLAKKIDAEASTSDVLKAVTAVGSQTNVLYNADGNVIAGNQNNTFSNVKIVDKDGVDVTASYAITTVAGNLKITPRGENVADGGASFVLALSAKDRDGNTVVNDANTFPYTGANIEPTLVVTDTTLTKDGSALVLEKGTDYDIVAEAEDTSRTAATSAKAVGKYQYKVVMKGNFQGTKYVSWEIQDVDAPEAEVSVKENVWKNILSTITFGLFSKDDLTFTLSGTEEEGGSGIAQLAYYVVADTAYDAAAAGSSFVRTLDQLKALPDEQWQTLSFEMKNGSAIATITKENTFKGVVYLRVTDVAGHVSYACSDGVIVENVKPEIKLVAQNSTYCLEKQFAIEDAYPDTVTVTDKDGKVVLSKKAADFTAGRYEGILKPATGQAYNIYTIVARDKAGNETTYKGIRVNAKHIWKYIKDADNKMHAVCDNDNCPDYHSAEQFTVVISSNDVVYDGKAHGAKVNASDDFASQKVGQIGEITYYQTQEAGKITGGSLVTEDDGETSTMPVNVGNYYAKVVVTVCEGPNAKKESATLYRAFQITKAPLASLELSEYEVAYTGKAVGPETITVKAKLGAELKEVVLVKDKDYVITEDTTAGKVTKAVRAGKYTVEVVAKEDSNYQGTLSKTFIIKESDAPIFAGASENGIYCKGKEIKVTDPNLTSVKIEGQDNDDKGVLGAGYTVVDAENLIDSYTYTLPGSKYGTKYTITAKDISGNINVLHLLVYLDHEFRLDDYVKQADGMSQIAPCAHGCGSEDVRQIRWGEVNFNYEYNYWAIMEGETEPVEHAGVQGKEARLTDALVYLCQETADGTKQIIATKHVNCKDTCGQDESIWTAKCKFSFESYNPEDSTKDSGSHLIPTYDENGDAYSYSILVVLADKEGHEVEPEHYDIVQDAYYASASDVGHKADITYSPGNFNVPWQVNILHMPVVGGEMLVPDSVSVKVMFAYTADAGDTYDAHGFQIISQQAGGTGLVCQKDAPIKDENGVVIGYSYKGKYPVWKHQGETDLSYYHRIKVSGFTYGSDFYGVEDQELVSPREYQGNNNIIYYINPAEGVEGGASGTIYYDIDALTAPMVLFDTNEGTDTMHQATRVDESPAITEPIRLNAVGGKLTESDLGARKLEREGYVFMGWYLTKYEATDGQNTNGDKESSDPNEYQFKSAQDKSVVAIESLRRPITLYARWKELAKPTGTIEVKKASGEGARHERFEAGDQIETVLHENITFNQLTSIFFAHKQTVTITAMDNEENVQNSGVDKIYYHVAKAVDGDITKISYNAAQLEAKAAEAGFFTEYTSAFSMDEAKTYVIYAKLVDKAGNVTYISTKDMSIDLKAPQITGVVDNAIYCLKQQINVSDEHLAQVLITDADGKQIYKETAEEGKLADGKFSYILQPSQKWYQIVATDQAGNETVVSGVYVNEKHTWKYEKDAVHTLHAVCENANCPDYQQAKQFTVSISANDVTYDGQPHGANVIVSDEFATENVGSIGEITYYQTEEAGEITGGALVTEEDGVTSCQPTEAGHYFAKVNVTVCEGPNAQIESETLAIPFSIMPKEIETLMLSQMSYVYDKKTHEPQTEVFATLLGLETQLELGTDYTVSYENNVKAGTATVTVSGCGNYCGSLSEQFTIVSGQLSAFAEGFSGVYDGRKHQIKVTTSDEQDSKVIYYAAEPLTAENYLQKGAKTPASYQEPGSYTTYFYIVSENYEPVTGDGRVQIAKAESKIEAQDVQVTYDGQSKAVAPSLSKGDGTLRTTYYKVLPDGSKTSVIGLPKEAGIYEAVMTASETARYKATGLTKKVVILPRKVTLSWGKDQFVYDGKEHQIEAAITNKVAGDEVYVATYEDNRGVAADEYTAVAVSLGGAQAGNYMLDENAEALEHDWSIEEAEDDPEKDEPDDKDADKDSTAKKPTKKQLEENSMLLDAGLKVSQKGTKIQVAWGKVSSADGYDVYVQYCGKSFVKKPEGTANSANVTKVVIKKIGGKALNLKKNYKLYVVAYKNINGKKVTLAKSITAHIVGHNNHGSTNVKKVTLKKAKYSLKKKQKVQIQGGTVLVDPKKKPLSDNHAKELRYRSSNKKVAKVSKTGEITATGKGKCTIYVYARNGYAKKVTVTVK